MELFKKGTLGGSGNWVDDTKSRITNGDAATNAAINHDGATVTKITGDHSAGDFASKHGKMPTRFFEW